MVGHNPCACTLYSIMILNIAVGYIDDLIKETVTLCSKRGSTSSTEPTSHIQPKSLSSGYEKPDKCPQ